MISKQEMFNRAWIGLKSQGFQRCTSEPPHLPGCVYADNTGKHCAWGWVDVSLTAHHAGPVGHLDEGLAVGLDPEHLTFATRLQQAHDKANKDVFSGLVLPHHCVADNMVQRLTALARDYGLTIPTETP